MKKIFCILGITALGCLAIAIVLSISNVRYEEHNIRAMVISKEYEAPRTYTSMMCTGKTTIPVVNTVPAEYNVTVKYKKLTSEMDSEPLYKALKVGDSINMILVKKYKKDTNEFLGESIKQP